MPAILHLKCLMPYLTPRSILTWVTGYLTARVWQYIEYRQPGSIEFLELSRDLRLTRTALEEHSTCEADLRTEIRYSSTLSVSLNGILFVEVCLVLAYLGLEVLRWVSNHSQIPIQDIRPSPSQEESDSGGETSSGSSPPIVRSGPLRPSDLRQ